MRHIPNLKELTVDEIQEILNLAAEIKANRDDYLELLRGQSLAMLFQKTSTRTRVSFEVAMTELGGHAAYIDWTTSNFVLSGIEYESAYLSRNVQFIMARLMHHEDLLKIMSTSQVPVINGCCEKFHPCQALTDVLSITEHTDKPLNEVRLAYVGVQNNVSNSLVIICDKLGIELSLGTPPPDDNGESRDAYVEDLIQNSSQVQHETDPHAAVRNADFVYTDTWVDMQYFNNPDFADEKEAKTAKMAPYQINRELIGDQNCQIMHDMPIHDGYEIAADMVTDDRSIIFEQAANRLHAQKGLLAWLAKQD